MGISEQNNGNIDEHSKMGSFALKQHEMLNRIKTFIIINPDLLDLDLEVEDLEAIVEDYPDFSEFKNSTTYFHSCKTKDNNGEKHTVITDIRFKMQDEKYIEESGDLMIIKSKDDGQSYFTTQSLFVFGEDLNILGVSQTQIEKDLTISYSEDTPLITRFAFNATDPEVVAANVEYWAQGQEF